MDIEFIQTSLKYYYITLIWVQKCQSALVQKAYSLVFCKMTSIPINLLNIVNWLLTVYT